MVTTEQQREATPAEILAAKYEIAERTLGRMVVESTAMQQTLAALRDELAFERDRAAGLEALIQSMQSQNGKDPKKAAPV